MNWFLPAVIVILIIALGALIWRHTVLRRRLRRYANAIRKIANEDQRGTDLLKVEPGLEELSNAVMLLVRSEREHSSEAEVERARLAAVLQRMTDGVLIADAAGHILFSNPAAGKLGKS